MNREEAKRLLQDHLQTYRRRPYQDLMRLIGEIRVAEVRGPSGANYQIEVEIHWDQHPGGSIHVLAGSMMVVSSPRFRPFATILFLRRMEPSPESDLEISYRVTPHEQRG